MEMKLWPPPHWSISKVTHHSWASHPKTHLTLPLILNITNCVTTCHLSSAKHFLILLLIPFLYPSVNPPNFGPSIIMTQ